MASNALDSDSVAAVKTRAASPSPSSDSTSESETARVVQEQDLSSSESEPEPKPPKREQQQEWKTQEQERPPLACDDSQKTAVGEKEGINDDDWATRNQGTRGKVSGLVNRFTRAIQDAGNDQSRSTYRTDRGVNRPIGQIRQTKWR